MNKVRKKMHHIHIHILILILPSPQPPQDKGPSF